MLVWQSSSLLLRKHRKSVTYQMQDTNHKISCFNYAVNLLFLKFLVVVVFIDGNDIINIIDTIVIDIVKAR
jgi:hypothetical protein